jgi:5'-nucleotidase
MIICAFHILFTHDLHSHFERWPRVVTTIKRQKQKYESQGESVFVFDIGDHVDRAHMITEATAGRANIDLMNAIGYDGVTIGNNEGITFSKEKLDSLYTYAQFDVLVNNLYDSSAVRPSWLKPWKVIESGGLNIGVIGTTVDFQLFYGLLGWQCTDPVQAVRDHVNRLRDKVDFLILLSHLGLGRDRQLAHQVPGIDLILGGHTHHLLAKGEYVQGTWIHQVGKFGQYVGHVRVKRTADIFRMQPQAISTENEEPDAQTTVKIAEWTATARHKLNENVATVSEGLEVDWLGESQLGNLLAESLNDWCQTDIAIVNSGQMLESLPPGSITRSDIHRICPHPINPCRIKLTGKQILSILERSLDKNLQRLPIKGFGFRGKMLGTLAVDGLSITYVPVQQEYVQAQREDHAGPALTVLTGDTEEGARQGRIKAVQVGEKRLDPNRDYEVATIDMFTFGSIFPELYKRQDIEYLVPEFLRDLLAARLQQGDLHRASRPRWHNALSKQSNCNHIKSNSAGD